LDYYEKNLKTLPGYLAHLGKVMGGELPADVAVRQAKSGLPTIRYNNKLIHSAYNPVADAEKFCNGCGIKSDEVILCYGFGLGYHIESILNRIGEDGRLLVIELNMDLLNAAFKVRDLEPILSDPRMRLVARPNEIDTLKQLNSDLNIFLAENGDEKKVVVYTPCFQSMPPGFDKVRNLLGVVLMEKAVPVVHREQSQENLAANLDVILTSHGVSEVLPVISQMACFVVGAGPSLDEALPYLREHQNSAWIFAIDTALPALLNSGARPDFVVSVDPQPESAEHFTGHWDCGVPLIITPTSNDEVVARYTGPKLIVVQQNHSVVRSVEHFFLGKGFTEGGGSGSCIALDIAMRYSANPVILVGQDCGYPDMKVYSSNVIKTSGWLGSTNRFNTLEMVHRKMAMTQDIVYAGNKYGEQVPTHRNLFSYQKEIERIASAHSELQCYNFLSRGVKLKGVQDIFFVEEVEDMLSRPIDKGIEVTPLPLDESLRESIRKTLAQE
jgi:hypothetical protein